MSDSTNRVVHWEERCFYCEECGKEVSFFKQYKCSGCSNTLDWENVVELEDE